jgi:hypothetical protein
MTIAPLTVYAILEGLNYKKSRSAQNRVTNAPFENPVRFPFFNRLLSILKASKAEDVGVHFNERAEVVEVPKRRPSEASQG